MAVLIPANLYKEAMIPILNMLYIVLLEPEHPGNLGAVARVMANFGLWRLVLITPKCKKDDVEAIKRAKHAQHILKKAIVIKEYSRNTFKRFDYVIGTTAKLGTDYNIPRSPVTPKQLAEKLRQTSLKNTRIAVLIGREGIGLTNEEVMKCDYIVSIPTYKKYPTLNISHACAIIFYELFQQLGRADARINAGIFPANEKDKEIMLKRLYEVLDNIKFSTPDKKRTQQIVWKRIVGKSMMTKREAFAAIGLWKKILERIKK